MIDNMKGGFIDGINIWLADKINSKKGRIAKDTILHQVLGAPFIVALVGSATTALLTPC